MRPPGTRLHPVSNWAADPVAHGAHEAGRKSPYSLYRQDIVTFEEGDYDHADAQGFIRLFGLPMKVQAMMRERNK